MECDEESDIVRLEEIAAKTDGFSGADLRDLCQQAGELALSESIIRTAQSTSDADVDTVDDVLDVVCHRHFEEALQSARRSVSDAEAARYDKLCQSLRSGEAMPPPPEEAVPPPEAALSAPAPESAAVVGGREVRLSPCSPPNFRMARDFDSCSDLFMTQFSELMNMLQQQLSGGMEAHLRARHAPGVPKAAAAADAAKQTEDDAHPGDVEQTQMDAGGGPGGESAAPTGEALTQELGLLKASIGMVSARVKELQKKSESDEEYVNFVRSWLEDQAQRAALNNTTVSETKSRKLAAEVGAFAAGVGRAVEILEQVEAKEAAEHEAV